MKSTNPNILLAISDDQAWPHTSAYGCQFVNTPAFDRIASQGVLFQNAFCTSPSCSPSRASLLTGRNMWQLEEGGLLHGQLPAKYNVYPDILEEQGYHIGFTNKGWGPGSIKASRRTRNPAGPRYDKRKIIPPTSRMGKIDYSANFQDFLNERPEGAPFCFWYGSKEPHRGYEKGSGLRSGKKLETVVVPPYLPDCDEVRSDLLDYALEIEWFDKHLGQMITKLEEISELDKTIIVVTGDNGLPFPRAKANLYHHGIHVPLAIRWPQNISGGRTVTDFVSFIDLAPTFLEAAGLEPLSEMTGKSLINILTSSHSGRVDPLRNQILAGLERHTYSRPGNIGYPCRCIHTDDYLYIHNYKPERWPAGNPDTYSDIDNSPTKKYMITHYNDEKVGEFFKLAFGKRPREELYSMKDGYACLNNMAYDPSYGKIKEEIKNLLENTLREQDDPRMFGKGDVYDTYKYYVKP